MDHTTPTTDTDALMAEVDALLAEEAVLNERVDALLASWAPQPTARQRMDALWAGVAQLATWDAQLEAQQAALAAEIDAIERDD
jgi:hypothetical protein